MTKGRHVIWFEEPDALVVEIAGGKGASLASMTAQGLPVSPGFVIPSDLMEKYVDGEALRTLARAKNHVGAMWLIEETAMLDPPVLEAYATLGGKVAVRSSASAEDCEAASYAGQQGSDPVSREDKTIGDEMTVTSGAEATATPLALLCPERKPT